MKFIFMYVFVQQFTSVFCKCFVQSKNATEELGSRFKLDDECLLYYTIVRGEIKLMHLTVEE